MKKNIYIYIAYSSSLLYLIDANWLIGFILALCKVARKKKSAVNKWVTLMIINSYIHYMIIWEKKLFYKK